VRTYAAIWAALFGEPAGKVGLWFADTGTYVPVSVPRETR